MTANFWCPRRVERELVFVRGPFFYPDPADDIGSGDKAPDSWRGPDAGEWEGTCSYCGSVSPQTFLAYVKAGLKVGATDKGYKAYLHDLPSLHPEATVIRSSTFDRSGERPAGDGWLSREEIEAIAPEALAGHLDFTFAKIEPQGPRRFGKFYLQHFAHRCSERAEWYDLYLAGKVNFGEFPWYARGMVGLRAEHLLRYPDEMTDAERAAIDAATARGVEGLP